MGDNHVLQRRHFLEDGRLLKRPHNPAPCDLMRRQTGNRLSIVVDSARCRRHERADQFEQSTFSGAIRSDHGQDRALFNGEADVINRGQTAKPLGYSLNVKDRHGQLLPPSRLPSRRRAKTQYAVRKPEHARDHEDAIDERLVILDRMQKLESNNQQKGTDDRTENVGKAAQETVEHEVNRIRDRISGGVNILVKGGKKCATDSPHETTDPKSNDAIFRDVDADGGGQIFILTQRPKHPAKAAGR